ncbi:hypothetical protein [Niabella beijingensis]|uniref:hypothetical protein n=1 Tax=Niabella beijingensis TaxID=2872700 RepID=UPI001CBF6FC2|nr:hypothetical protein [Niabella beijingensis]MBZ4187656.1 hypothetical protein [Niabella beijingensis]
MANNIFDKAGDRFSFVAHGVTLKCERMNLPRVIAFNIVFSSSRKPIVITKAKNAEKKEFWTSVPEGRQQEAEGVGRLIEEYLTNRDK